MSACRDRYRQRYIIPGSEDDSRQFYRDVSHYPISAVVEPLSLSRARALAPLEKRARLLARPTRYTQESILIFEHVDSASGDPRERGGSGNPDRARVRMQPGITCA